MNHRAFVLTLACLVLPAACQQTRSDQASAGQPTSKAPAVQAPAVPSPADSSAANSSPTGPSPAGQVLPSPAGQAPATPRSEVALAAGLSFADATTIAAPKDFLRDFAARPAPGQVNAVVEIPTGTNEKWEVKLDGIMRWDRTKDGSVRVVKYLGYPGNYGIVPRAILGKEVGGDGDPLDVVVLGPTLPRGSVVPVRPIGTIRLADAGETDDKILAVPAAGPLGDLRDLEQLDAKFPGVTAILRTWFENYKGPGVLVCKGFGSLADADQLIEQCTKSFAAGSSAVPPGGARK